MEYMYPGRLSLGQWCMYSPVPRLSPVTIQQTTFELVVKTRKGRAWYVKSRVA